LARKWGRRSNRCPDCWHGCGSVCIEKQKEKGLSAHRTMHVVEHAGISSAAGSDLYNSYISWLYSFATYMKGSNVAERCGPGAISLPLFKLSPGLRTHQRECVVSLEQQ